MFSRLVFALKACMNAYGFSWMLNAWETMRSVSEALKSRVVMYFMSNIGIIIVSVSVLEGGKTEIY